ncbi:MAG: undecaprenyl-phosphate glucose phosphotransferase [Myxococcales bacterium]|nr:undecaprenyl-phosphate glucose phosphotransferase [Myxococcales bacterium]MDD9969948.1 undecaprenyl-phosphate glucose phosphotransferase [Myxococcales bacterium]
MLKRYNGLVGLAYRVADAAIIVAVWNLCYWIRFSLFATTGKIDPELGHIEMVPFEVYASLSPAVAVLWLFVFSWRGIYESRRMVRMVVEFRDLLQAHAIALLMFIGFAYFVKQYKYSRMMMAHFALIAGFAICFSHGVIRVVLRCVRRRGFNLRRLLIVGESDASRTVIDRMRYFPELGMKVVGVVTPEGRSTQQVNGAKVLGHIADIRELVQETGVDEVFVALAHEQSTHLERLLGLLQDETVAVRVVPDVQAYVTLGCEAEDFDGLPVVRINDSPHIGIAAMAKRALDIAGSAIALIVLSPVLLAISALVKLTSPGPIFYAQERMGLDGKTFRMYKFRSMRQDAERMSGAVWANKNDDRRTRLGTFLRKTSLDELPQFWNVLRGDMSLVGPRPERPVFVRKFREEIPHYMLRHKVKAGITGWAQVNGWRGNTSLDRRIECDLFYIKNWSLSLDLRILLMTIWRGFIHKNAY